jgi:hypothetical protein
LRSGYSIVVALPDPGPPALLEALCTRMDANGWDRPRVNADGTPPLENLFDALALEAGDSQARNLNVLLERLSAGQVVIVDEIDSTQWRAWRHLIVEYERLSRSHTAFERPLLLLIVRGVPRADLPVHAPALKVCIWDDAVSEIDMLAYADLLLCERGVTGPQRRLAATTIARLALWDPLVAQRLSQLPTDVLFAPHAALESLATEWGWRSGETPTWERGTYARVDGVRHAHSALLALGDKTKELEMRIWSAQASIILPLIELQRRNIVNRIQHRLDMPRTVGDESIGDPFDLEIGELGRAAQAANLDRGITNQIARLRYLRNRLAHLELLTLVDATDGALHTVG